MKYALWVFQQTKKKLLTINRNIQVFCLIALMANSFHRGNFTKTSKFIDTFAQTIRNLHMVHISISHTPLFSAMSFIFCLHTFCVVITLHIGSVRVLF